MNEIGCEELLEHNLEIYLNKMPILTTYIIILKNGEIPFIPEYKWR